ncbi:MAG: hypothetical protein Q9188_007681, partial [Gyalolechia gomerana]
RGKGVEEEDGSDEDGEAEEEIWKALVESRPEIEGSEGGSEDDEGFDVEMDELDEEMGSDEGSEGEIGDKEGTQRNGTADLDDDEGMPDFGEDDDALLGSDDDVPSDLEAASEQEVKGAELKDDKKKKGKKAKRMKFKQLPTFASADDYAGMLEGEGDKGEGL